MNKSRINVRCANVEDAEQMANLFMRAWQISLNNFIPEGFINRFSHAEQKKKYGERIGSSQWIILLTELDNNIVGMIAATDNHYERLDYQKEIRAMYVDPDFHRRGIGSLLFRRVFSELKKQNARNVMLWCIEANNKAGSFYEKLGGRRNEIINPPEEYSAMPHVIYTWEFPD